jgi:hypothetical protein
MKSFQILPLGLFCDGLSVAFDNIISHAALQRCYKSEVKMKIFYIFCNISEKYLSLEILEEGCRNKSTSKNSGMKFTPLLHLDL